MTKMPEEAIIAISLSVCITVLFAFSFAVWRWVISPRAQRQYFDRHRGLPEETMAGV